MMTSLSGAEQRPLAISPVVRRHSTAEMAAEATSCFAPERMPC